MFRDDEVGADEPAPRGEQPPQEGSRDSKRWIGDNPESLAGEPEVARVRLDDNHAIGGETFSQEVDAPIVELHGNDARSRLDERAGERSIAGTYVEHEFARFDSGLLDEERGPSAIEPVIPPPGRRPPGHGGP
jgi:hypothetical protein